MGDEKATIRLGLFRVTTLTWKQDDEELRRMEEASPFIEGGCCDTDEQPAMPVYIVDKPE